MAMRDLGERAAAAARVLATAPTSAKDAALNAAADLLVERAPEILNANAEDIARAEAEDTTREAAVEFMRLRGLIDCLIPRGGPSLIQAVLDNATVPYVIDGDGNCHVYVDSSADLKMAHDIVVNAKTQRPSVCNAAESLLVHEAVADVFLPRAVAALEGVELVGDDRSRAI